MDVHSAFPKLTSENHALASPATEVYNCTAFAAGDRDNWWWPDRAGMSFWPAGVVREESSAAFQQAFATIGYELCASAELENGYEKVAIYAIGGVPAHAARQLSNGRWVSKLGELEDIEHANLDLLTGRLYGEVVAILRRAVT